MLPAVFIKKCVRVKNNFFAKHKEINEKHVIIKKSLNPYKIWDLRLFYILEQ